MKLVRYRCNKHACQNKECYGPLLIDNVVCLHSLAKTFNLELPPTLSDFISLGDDATAIAERILERASPKDVANASLATNQVKLLAPIVFPPKIVCLDLNYKDHVSEMSPTIPD